MNKLQQSQGNFDNIAKIGGSTVKIKQNQFLPLLRNKMKD